MTLPDAFNYLVVDASGFVVYAFSPQDLDILPGPVWVLGPFARLVFEVPQFPADRQGDKVIIICIKSSML